MTRRDVQTAGSPTAAVIGQDASLDVVAHAIDLARRAGAREADAVFVDGRSYEARVRGQEIDFVKQAHEKVLGIRVLVDGPGGLRSAVTSTSDVAADAVTRMAEETVALARATAPDPHAGLPEDGFETDPPDLDLFDADDRGVPVEARIEDARRAEAAAREVDPRIQNSEGSEVASGFTRIAYGNSKGFLHGYETASHSLFSEPLAIEGEVMQRDYWMTVGRKLADLEDAGSVGQTAARRALRRLGSKRVATGEAAILFDRQTAPSLLGHIVGAVSGYAIYRNSSVLADKLGEKIACGGFTLNDDGRRPGGLGSKPFDGEGLPTRRNTIVEDGVLKTWLLDSYSARKLGMASTGNASRGAGSGPGVGITNLWLEPGELTLDEMIARTERGLLVTELIGMGVNPTTGDYSRGAAGLWIEHGEIVHPVEEVTIAGNLLDMFSQIDQIGSELVWRGRTACPALRVASMTIAGE
jgi:PmbA protein